MRNASIATSTSLDDLPNLLSISQVCAWSGFHPNTVRKLIRTGELRAIRFGSRTLRIPKDALIERLTEALTGT